MTFIPLTPALFVAPQIRLEAVAAARQHGVTLIINNRPEGESPDQTPGAEIETAARAAGIDYVAIPVGHGGFSQPQVDAMADALAGAEGKILAYCRSGTRSTLLWALARAKCGADPEILSATAAEAGYDLSPIRPLLDMLKGQQ
ncbi:MAG: TIGR01244 family sulfur transferase [Pseudomonadota bacterium]